jgi:hypothetical protein
MGQACSTHEREGKGFIQDFGGTNVDGRTILKWILERSDEVILTGLTLFRIGTNGGLL